MLLYTEADQQLRVSEAMTWHKGQSGNPGEVSKGARRKLSDALIRALARDWQAHGKEVIKRVRALHPSPNNRFQPTFLPPASISRIAPVGCRRQKRG
jgi:hypothetical protein